MIYTMTMNLQPKTLEYLRDLINEKTEYRSGPKLVLFFNTLGFSDQYEQGFPSRWIYTDEKLSKLNGTPKLNNCIKKIFAPINYVGKFSELDSFIKDFNQYLVFDGWKVIRNGKEITFEQSNDIDFSYESTNTDNEEQFLNKKFGELKIDKLALDSGMQKAIEQRIVEIKNCIQHESPLAMIFLCGSTIEGLLLDLATNNLKKFNKSSMSPKDKNGKVYPIHNWNLQNLIDVACKEGFIGEDIKKFSHVLRNFRNYIHPNKQVLSKFNPDKHTAKICWQVFQALIADLNKNTE